MKILCLDGGGVFGIVQATILSKTSNLGKFDVIAGTSIGSVVGGANITWDDALAGAQYDTTCTTNTGSDHLTFTYQTPHKRLTNSHLGPHVHYWQTNADQTNMWFIRYAFTGIGQTNVADTYVTVAATNTQTYSVGSLHQMALFPDIDGNGKGVSSTLRIKLYRANGRGTGNVTVTDLDCHIDIDSLGSDSELGKSF